MSKILFVLTSHTRLGETGRPTGFYFEELAVPYWRLTDAGFDVELASIQGGEAAHDPSSLSSDAADAPEAVRRFLNSAEAMAKLSATLPIALADPLSYAAVFLPGGHGVMWDFAENEALARFIGLLHQRGGVVGAVCHGPAGLLGARRSDGRPIVDGLKVNSFTNAEEEAVGLTSVVPFLLEDELRKLGGRFEAGPNFTAKALRDGRLVTGQNPMSSDAVATLMIDALRERASIAA